MNIYFTFIIYCNIVRNIIICLKTPNVQIFGNYSITIIVSSHHTYNLALFTYVQHVKLREWFLFTIISIKTF